MNKLRLLTVARHAQHRPSDGDPLIDHTGLTSSGELEARLLGESLREQHPAIDTLATYNSTRALSSVALLTQPNLCSEDVPSKVSEILANGSTHIDTELDYIQPQPGEFADKLLASYLQFRNFEFLVNESDPYDSDGEPISSYSRMASTGARYVLNKEYDGLHVHICSREFIFTSLAAKLILLSDGKSAERDYASRYSRTIEESDSGRVNLVTIKSDGTDVTMSGGFFDIKAPMPHVQKIYEGDI